MDGVCNDSVMTLHQRIAALEEELGRERAARQRAEAADRTKDEVLAMLAHELRQPMSAMFPAIEVRRRSSDLHQRQRADAVVEEQLAHMARLVGDLADASKMTRGAVDLRCERLDLRSSIVQALDVIASQLQRREHVVTVDITQEPLWVNGDPTRLKQIFSNLLQNAAVYTPHGGTIAASATAQDGHAVFRVRDSGVGIAADSLERIFRLFERGQHDGSSVSLGVGLALVRRLVEQHGGTVSAFSDGPNRGSEFVVKLPLTSHTV